MDAFCIILHSVQLSNKPMIDHNRILTKNIMLKGLLMKNKLLAASLLSALALPAFADGANDDQDVKVTVPEVTLLDVKDATSNTITMIAPSTAGDGFAPSEPLVVTYALSSNVAAVTSGGASTARKKVTASLGVDLPDSWKLSANMDATGDSNGTSTSEGKVFFDNQTSVDLLTEISNERTPSDQNITYILEPTDAMMAFETNRTITITYTLEDV